MFSLGENRILNPQSEQETHFKPRRLKTNTLNHQRYNPNTFNLQTYLRVSAVEMLNGTINGVYRLVKRRFLKKTC